MVRGLQFLATHGPTDELFTISQHGQVELVEWPEPLYPFLLINLGSGVSVLRVSSPTEFTRMCVRWSRSTDLWVRPGPVLCRPLSLAKSSVDRDYSCSQRRHSVRWRDVSRPRARADWRERL